MVRKDAFGAWRWQDGFFCRSLSALRAAPQECQQWPSAGDRARPVRDRGVGEATIHAIREERHRYILPGQIPGAYRVATADNGNRFSLFGISS